MGVEKDLALRLVREFHAARAPFAFRVSLIISPWMLREGLINGTLGGAETDEEIGHWCGADDLYITDENGETVREWHRG